MNPSPAMPPSDTADSSVAADSSVTVTNSATVSRSVTVSSSAQRPHLALRQFVKFCIVGASNFALDAGTAYVLTYMFHMDWRVAATIAFIVGVSNSFFWNSRWTFRALDRARQTQQYILFFGINVVGYTLNLTIMSGVIYVLSGTLQDEKPDKAHWIAAKLIATAIVVAWNFGANKKWTFKA